MTKSLRNLLIAMAPLGVLLLIVAYFVLVSCLSMPQDKLIAYPSPSFPVYTPTGAPSSDPSTVSINLPPLYSGAEWETTKPGKMTITRKTSSGARETVNLDTYRTESTVKPLNDLGISSFISYYESELGARGWQPDPQLDAGGPTGEQEGYTKDSHYFVFGWNSVSKGVGQQNSPASARLFFEYK